MSNIEPKNFDRWIGLHLPDAVQKRADFAELIDIEGQGGPLLTDAIIMLCEAFKDAANADPAHVEDFANWMQYELFKHTIVNDQAQAGYVKWLKTGRKNYRIDRDRSGVDQELTFVSEFLNTAAAIVPNE